MINKIRIRNFKNLEDTGEIELKPLNFLFGPNGSGKSSLFKALMFLQKNIFPLNKSENLIYEINEEINLGSYKEIINGNDVNKDLIFEFEISEFISFPKYETIINNNFESNQIEELIKSKSGKNNFVIEESGILKNSNFITFLDFLYKKYVYPPISIPGNDSELHFQDTNNKILGHLLEEKQISFQIIFRFNKYDNDGIVGDLELIDKLNNIKLIFSNEGELGFFINSFIFENNTNLTTIFYDYLYYSTPFSEDIPQIPSLNDFLTLKIKPWAGYKISFKTKDGIEHTNENLEEEKSIIEFWNKMTIDEKKEVYYKFLLFCYTVYRVIPKELKYFLSIFHLPQVREIPKSKFLLEQGRFKRKVYYDFLNDFKLDQIDVENALQYPDNPTEMGNKYKEIFSKLIEIINTNYLTVKNNTDFVKGYNSRARLIYKGRDEYENILEIANENLFLNTNFLLKRIGINNILYIDSNDDIGRIFLMNNQCVIVNYRNSSSGLIQLIPIIFTLFLLRKPIEDKLEMKSLIDKTYKLNIPIKYVFKRFEEKINYYDNYFQTLFIEQPELHLHPKLQVKLSFEFTNIINEIKKNIYSCNDNRRLFIETHSEHIIRKIQVMIAQGDINKDLVGVFYFDNKSGKTSIKKMEIEDNGLFKEPWPDGFFDESTNLTMDLMEALSKRSKN